MITERAGVNKQVLHHIACSLVKQQAESGTPWNLGELSLLTPLLLAPRSSPAPFPVSSRSSPVPVQPSRPSSGSPPTSMPACQSPSEVSLRDPSPPLLPPLLFSLGALSRPRLAGAHSHTSPGITSTCLTLLTQRIALVLAACAGSTVAPSSPHQLTATTPRAAPSSQPSVPFPFLLFLLHCCPISLTPNPTLCDLLLPPFYPIGTFYTHPLTMSSRKRKAGEEEELVSLPSGDEESEEE